MFENGIWVVWHLSVGFLILKESPLVEPVRIHNGAEENKGALRKSRGEEDEAFQILEYQAQKGNAGAMYRIGLFYYFGLRGLRRGRAKAADKGEAQSMEFLGEIYARGAGVERNYTKALEWLTLAARQQLYLAYNGMGYLHVKGYGVDKKNYTKAKEYFEKAAEHEETGGHYNLGVMYYKGIGVKRNVKLACKYFLVAANAGHQKAFYQLAKMFHTGVGLKKNLHMATALYKIVAERGPWSSLSRWALESYLKGDLGKAFLLYSRMAELGYDTHHSGFQHPPTGTQYKFQFFIFLVLQHMGQAAYLSKNSSATSISFDASIPGNLSLFIITKAKHHTTQHNNGLNKAKKSPRGTEQPRTRNRPGPQPKGQKKQRPTTAPTVNSR
ncbi:hypothetical protein Q3G72_033550 [Acer saccharum]|nr:hypothetical protein Q3G72_033550 [Acer saccharum]